MNRLIILILLVAGLLGASWLAANRYSAAVSRAEKAEARAAAYDKALAQSETNVITVTEYVDRVRTVRERGETIIKEVPVYVTQEADDRCDVPAGFVWLHDDAAENTPRNHAGNPDARAEGIELSTVAATVAGNYAICHENAEQLKALQQYIRTRDATEETK